MAGQGGVHLHEDKASITVPSALFIKALEKLLDKMTAAGFDFERVVALTGDAQMCGGVFWKHGARKKLQTLDFNKTMFEQLEDAFSIPDPPDWQDSTSRKQCRELEQAVGGPMELAKITGSRAFEHNTSTQIMRIFQTQRNIYDNTERVCVIGTLLASLVLGDYAPIDFGDASIMNLMDIRRKNWSPECLAACGTGLASKLVPPVSSNTILGNVSSYLVQKYKFSDKCKVLAFTGDNINSAVGLLVKNEQLIVTLGTGDCLFHCSPKFVPNLYGDMLVSALDSDIYIPNLIFKNASRTRQRVMERCAGSWEKFTELFNSTPPGNDGNIGIYFDETEIVPEVKGTFRFNRNNEMVDSFPPEVEVRAVLESQFLARLMYAKRCGFVLGPQARILATGGASANTTILQVIADVFNTPVYTIDVPNSAPLGGAYRAKLAVEGLSIDALKDVEPVCAAIPTPGLQQIYEEMLERYQKLEEQIAAEFEEK